MAKAAAQGLTNRPLIARAINNAIGGIGRNLDELPADTIRQLLANSKLLRGMAVAYHIGAGSDELVAALRRFKCRPIDCFMGGLSKTAEGASRGEKAVADVIGLLDELVEYQVKGKISSDAWFQLSKLIKQMGESEGTAKGATEALAFIRTKLGKGYLIESVEASTEVVVRGRVTERIYDVVVKTPAPNSKILKCEVKAWRPDVLESKLFLAFRGRIKDLGTGKVLQLPKDLITAIQESFSGGILTDLDNISIRWLFDARLGDKTYTTLTKDDIVESFAEKLRNSPLLVKHLVQEIDDFSLFKKLDGANWAGDDYKEFVDSVGDILDHMIEINERLVR